MTNPLDVSEEELAEICKDQKRLCQYIWELAQIMRKMGMRNTAAAFAGHASELAEQISEDSKEGE